MSKTLILPSQSKFLQEWERNTDPRLFLLTAPSGAGKTTWCLQLAKDAATLGISVSGLCSPAVIEMGQKNAIDLLDLRSSISKRFATLKPASSVELATKHWLFDETTMQWGNTLLQQEISSSSELFILDELGPLELERNLGFVNSFPILDARQHRLACVVVRPSLLPLAQTRWPWANTLTLAEAGA